MASQAAALASSAWKFSPNGQTSTSTSASTQPPSSSSQLPPPPPTTTTTSSSSLSTSSIQNQNHSPGNDSPNTDVSPNSSSYSSAMMPGINLL